MMEEITCPVCNHSFMVPNFSSGNCPNCHKTEYYWDEGWDHETNETDYGFYWNELDN